uniref:ADP-ribosylation factor-like protein 2-binding protein n=1 Tax=Felis catus TaxID=9685 RepID=A0ABI7XRQ8_FELCA
MIPLNYSAFILPTTMSLRPHQIQSTRLLQKTFLGKFLGTDEVQVKEEDFIMDDEFQLLQRKSMDKYYQEFEDMEENKFTYVPIFNKCMSLLEKYIEE